MKTLTSIKKSNAKEKCICLIGFIEEIIWFAILLWNNGGVKKNLMLTLAECEIRIVSKVIRNNNFIFIIILWIATLKAKISLLEVK